MSVGKAKWEMGKLSGVEFKNRGVMSGGDSGMTTSKIARMASELSHGAAATAFSSACFDCRSHAISPAGGFREGDWESKILLDR